MGFRRGPIAIPPAPGGAIVATVTPEDEQAEALAPVEINSFGQYVQAWVAQLRGGQTGVLPVVAGLVLLTIIFQTQDSAFLSAGNLTNLMVQGATFVLLGMAEVFVLILGEIDLSTGFVAGIGAVITCELAGEPHNLPWWVAILAGLAGTAAIGAFQGTLVTRLKLPSFVVTLAGLLFWEGLLIFLINQAGPSNGGVISITNNVLSDIASNGELSTTAGWVVAGVLVVGYAVLLAQRDRRRRSTGLAAPPPVVTLLKIVIVAVVGIGAAWICNTNRGSAGFPLSGMPWVVLIVLAFVAAWTFLLGRTRFGRYLYAIGGNAEASRRAGINLTLIRTLAFTLSGLTSGAAGIIYASRLGSISTDIDGGTLVLFAVAAAVIGGASLFGGRGKMVHALLGGVVIAAIYNGMGLLGLDAADQYMITALVLLAAVTVDAIARRGQSAT